MLKLLQRKKKIELVEKQVIFFSLSNLMLSDFITVVVDGKYELLIKEGNPTKEQVVEHWDTLFLQYSDLIGESDTDYNIGISSEKQIATLRGKISLVSGLTKLLVEIYFDDFAKVLNEQYDFNIQYFGDEETYWKQFKKVQGRLKSWQVDLDLLLIQQPKKEESKQVTGDAFVNIIVVLEEHRKYRIEEDKTSVLKFGTMIRDYKKHIAALEKQNEKLK